MATFYTRNLPAAPRRGLLRQGNIALHLVQAFPVQKALDMAFRQRSDERLTLEFIAAQPYRLL